MSAPFKFVDAPSFMGSWPILPDTAGLPDPVFLPRTMVQRAAILGVVQETASGFDVGGLTFKLDVDGVEKTISFAAGGPYTLDEVITQVNVDAGLTVATRDNGFLRLESATETESGSLRVKTDTSPDVLFALGLFAGTESHVGTLVPSRTIDPARQTVLPDQFTIPEGETFEAKSFNRAFSQLALNTDILYGLTHRKRQAKATEQALASFSGQEFQINDTVYTGPDATPSSDQLRKILVVLHEDGNEVVLEEETVASSGTVTFTTDAATATGKTVCVASFTFGTGDPKGDYYVKSSGAGMGALSGVPLKILERLDANTAVVLDVDPTTGNRVSLATGVIAGTKIQVVPHQVLVAEIRQASGGTRAEQQQVTKHAQITITRVEKNNRIFCDGATFVTNNVAEGDLVVLADAVATKPFSNNGDYRVSQVIDNETLELVTVDYEPVVLNINDAPGKATVKTDGDFFANPYVYLNYTLPSANYKVVYKGQSSLVDIMDDVGGLAGASLEAVQEADDKVQETLLAVIGPSVSNFDQYLYGDQRISLEDLNYRLNKEHDGVGRHTDLHPNTIDMYHISGDGGVLGTAVKLWNNTSDVLTTPKFGLYDHAAGGLLMAIYPDGTIESFAGNATHPALKGTAVSGDGIGVYGAGYGAGTGVYGQSPTGFGVYGVGLTGNAGGVYGIGSGVGPGVTGLVSGGTIHAGVTPVAVYGHGGTTGWGAEFIASTSGFGAYAEGGIGFKGIGVGPGGGYGLWGEGFGFGSGVYGRGGGGSGIGGQFVGGSGGSGSWPFATGVTGRGGQDGGAGGEFTGTVGNPGILVWGNAGGAGGFFQGGSSGHGVVLQADPVSLKSALRIVPQSTAIGAGADGKGDVRIDSTDGRFKTWNGTYEEEAVCNIFSSVVNSDTKGSGVITENDYNLTVPLPTIPANTLNVGSTIRVRSLISVNAHNGGSGLPIYKLRMYLGVNPKCVELTYGPFEGNQLIYFEAVVIIRTGGVAQCSSWLSFSSGTVFYNAGPSVTLSASNLLKITGEMTVADAGNFAVLYQTTVDIS